MSHVSRCASLSSAIRNFLLLFLPGKRGSAINFFPSLPLFHRGTQTGSRKQEEEETDLLIVAHDTRIPRKKGKCKLRRREENKTDRTLLFFEPQETLKCHQPFLFPHFLGGGGKGGGKGSYRTKQKLLKAKDG